MKRIPQWLMTIACILGLAMAVSAAPKDPTKTDDPDFAIQGEYVGEASGKQGDQVQKATIGMQVIALGDQKFRAVFYLGGLPGDGWKKGAPKHEVEGQVVDGVARFADKDMVMTIKDGVAQMSDPNPQNKENGGTLKKVVRKSPTLGAKPPEGAIVLFDGKSGEEWNPGTTQDGLLCEGQNSKRTFGSCTLHIEFMLPFEPKGRGQGRGNSGCYLQSRYEVQILDSFGLAGANNEAGGIYSVADPAVNMCFPPLSWQTYDIEFTAAKFDETGKKTQSARMTVKHNGVVVHDNIEVPKSTTAAPLPEGPKPGPIHLQNHGHPVRFQNIWIVEKKD